MRIVYVNSAHGPGGGHTSAVEVSLGLAEKGHELFMVCHPRSPICKQLANDARLILWPIGIRADWNPYRILQLANLNRRVQPDLVLADKRNDVKMSVAARWLIGNFPIVNRFGAPGALKNSPSYRRIWGQGVQAIILNSHTMYQRMLVQIPWLKEMRIEVIHNGKDTRRYQPLPNLRARMRAELGIPDDAFVVSFHGMVQPRKNIDLLVRAVGALPANLRVHVLIIGGGPTLSHLRHLATELCAPATFTGLRQDIPEVLSAADASANLSLAEGFSNSVLEAMSCGLPQILSDATSHPEQVDHEVQGLLVPPREVGAVADAIRRLATDPAGRARMGAAARHRVITEFSRERMIDRYDAVLRETVAAYGVGRRE